MIERCRPALRLPAWVVALALSLVVAVPGTAGQITATLSANPGSIVEGGGTTFTLSVNDQPYSYYYNSYYYWPYYYEYYYGGTGRMTSVNASLDLGDGRGPITFGANPNSTTYTAYIPAQYPRPGTFTATVSGSAVSYDDTYYWEEYVPYGWWYGPYSNGSYGSYANISASTQVHVDNAAPAISQLTWVPQVPAGQDFSFSATASDPGLPGGEQLTFGWDFDGSGRYDSFVQTGVTTGSGTYHFDSPGNYTIGVKVVDSYGDSTLGSFNVEVDPAADPVPEPASLTLLAAGGLCLGGHVWRRHKAAGRVA
jgi:hypothetical protein